MKLALVSMDKQTIDPPLGLCYITSYLKKSGFSNIVIIDKEDEMKRLKREAPDLIGITATSIHFPLANELAKKIREELKVPVIIGGIHITTMPGHFKDSNFDVAVIGEGEQTTLELVELFEKSGFVPEKLRSIRGIMFRDGDNTVSTEPRELFQNLDDVPLPDRDALDMEKYLIPRRSIFPEELNIVIGMISSRGCPYRCVFCSSAKFWKNNVRFHSAERVVEEVKTAVEKYKIDHVNFWDDLFAADKKRVEKIAELLKEEGLSGRIKFVGSSRANIMDERLARAFKAMGLEKVFFGFESGSEPILDYLKKGTATVEQNRTASEICRSHGLKVGGFFIVGSPPETEEDMLKTLEFAKKYADTYSFFQLVPFPGTEIWEYAKAKGIVTDDIRCNYRFADLFTRDFKPEIVMTENVSAERFAQIHKTLIEQANRANYKKLRFRARYVKYLLIPRFLKRVVTNVGEIANYVRYAD